MKLKQCIFILLLCVLPSVVSAQFNMLFTSDNDLPNTLINKVAEDGNGMIWVATEDGLCKFDGSRFTTYKHYAKKENSLADNFVRTVTADKRGNIIVGTIAGVQIYHPCTDDFSPVISSKELKIPEGNVNEIQLMRNGDFLIVGNCAYTLHIDDDHTPVVKRNALSNYSDFLCCIEASDGKIWSYIQSKGVFCVGKDGKLRQVRDANGNMYDFSVFCNADDGSLYAGGVVSGVYVYNKVKGNFDLIQGTESLIRIRDIKTIPGTTLLCIACDGSGVHYFDYRTRHFTTYRQFEDPFIDISSQKAHTIYVNNEGVVWIGLYQKGLFMATHSSTPFSYVGPRSPGYNLVGDRCVTSILQTHDGNIWTATDNGGLYGFTPDFKPIRQFSASSIHFPTTALGLFEDSRHRVWFGSYGQGCGTVDLATGHCTYVKIDGVSEQTNSAYSFVEDKHGQIWCASMGHGILRFDEQKRMFVQYNSADPVTWADQLFYDAPHDRIYAGSYGGILWFSPSDPKKKHHDIIYNIVVFSISRVSANTLAFSTSTGLVLLDTRNNKIRTITTEQGLPTNSVYACQPGVAGHVWVSSTSGLTCVNIKNMTVESFTMRDGLQGNEFYKDASLVSRDGRLWFGGINGITCFRPSEIVHHKFNCDVRVVSLHADEQYILPDEDGCYTLSTDNSSFTLELATRPLYLTKRVVYSYHLDNGGWEQLPIHQNRVSFSNLGYGHHTLYAKTTIDGHDSKVSETDIYIEYPWYLHWWMLIVWMAIIALLARYGWREIQRRRKFREQLLEHKREEEVKESKLQFFMNVVHDLRTPLTLIATPLQKLLTTDTDASRQRLYRVMSRNSERLLRLTDQIMDLRKIDRGKMEILCKPTEVGRLVRYLTSTMDDISERRRQTITLKCKDDNIMLWLDNDCFEKIFVNIMSNALKYTPEGGKICVEWGCEATSEKYPEGAFHLSITDNGIGIPDEEKRNIFTRFYQVRQNGKHIKGTGIGLNLVYSLVKLHHGEIRVTDNPAGHGTCFTVLLPMGKKVFAPEELNVNAVPEDEIPDVPEEILISMEGKKKHKRMLKTRKTVLIVDDDDEIRTFLCEELAGIYNIIESINGKQALDVLAKDRVDLVISDVMMPEIDGIELCKRIRQSAVYTHIPVVLLTAKVSDRDRIEGLSVRADAYVTKPFNLELLMTIVDNLLRRNDGLVKALRGTELTDKHVETPKMESADDKIMERLMRCINENLDNPDLTSDFLAQEVGLSRVHLYRKLKELTNQSASAYIRNVRLTKAAEMLRSNTLAVSEISYRVGFKTPSHFTTAFHDLFGVSPTEYMKGVDGQSEK